MCATPAPSPTNAPTAPNSLQIRSLTLSRPESPCEGLPHTPSQTRSSSPTAEDPTSGAAIYSPLWVSLRHVAADPLALSPNLIDTVADSNNPRPLRTTMRDSAEYWVKHDGGLAHFKIPARIDRSGQFSRFGPYFNLPATGLDAMALQKARAQFELVILDESDVECPHEAVMCSGLVFPALFAFHSEVESARVEANSTRKRNVIPFWRTYEPGRGDRYALIVSTDPLFENLPSTNHIPTPRISRSDISRPGHLTSPSKARARVAASLSSASPSIAPATSVSESGTAVLRIADLPDPYGRYAGVARSFPEVNQAKVHIPNIRNRHGVLITPAEYDDKIQDGDYVEIEFILKLWEIPPSARNNTNGSRVYQAILRSMKLLPFRTYSQAGILGSGPSVPPGAPGTIAARVNKGKGKAPAKGKRKADDDELPGQSPTKKGVVVHSDNDDGDDFEIVNMETDE